MVLNFIIKKQVTLLLVFTSLLISSKITAQGTTCAGATSVTVNGSCLTGQSISDGTIDTPANTCGPAPTREGWYMFNATATTATVSFAATNRNPYIEVFNGCAGSSMGCINANTGTSGHTETLNLTGLTAGVTYYIKIMNSTANNMPGDLCVTGPAAAPSNDDPTGATPVTIGATCSYTTFTNAGATATSCGTIPAPGCSSYTGGDVWFSVTIPASGGFILDSQTGVMLDGGAAVYSGSACGVMTLIDCDDDNSINGAMPMLTISGQTPGVTLYIRFWEYGNNNNGTFGLCLSALPIAPANDNCAGAYPVTVNSSSTACTSQTGGTLIGATASSFTNTCGGTADDDVWYSFVATSATHSITLNNVAGSTTDLYHSVYSGACGAPGTALVCSDPNNSILGGLTSGNTYFIRIFSTTATAGQTTTFSVCVNTPPPPPSNDNCSGAIAFPSIPTNGTCANLNNQSSANATNSGVIPTGACTFNSGTPDDDIWFSFVATNAIQTITGTWVSGNTDVYWQLFSGACGSSMTSVLCTDNNTGANVTGLTVGQTYYLRLYSWSGSGSTVQNICIQGPPPPPANDECTGAYPVTVNSSSTACTSQTGGTLIGATPSSFTNTCGGTADDDVWYSFVATATSHSVTLNNVAGSTTDLYHSVYSGVCGSPGTPLVCSDPNNSILGGLTIGNTYFIRIFSYTSTYGQTTTFSVCVNTPPPPPANDNPCSATPATVNSGTVCTVQTGGTVLGATASTVAIGSCFGTPDDDVWYSFVATNAIQNFSLTNVAGSVTDMYFSVHPGTCGAIGTAFICSDPNNGTVTGLIVGQTYYVRVYTYTSTGNQNTTFSLCITPPPPPPANDNCATPTTITVNGGTTCTSQANGTLLGATASSFTNACSGTADDDVWYSFVATSTTHSISINNVAGSPTDLYHSLYSGTCGSLGAPIICSDPNSSAISGLTVGATYFIRVFSNTSGTGSTTTFSVCVATPAPGPANDNPCSPTVVTVNTGTTCTSQSGGSLVNAYSSVVPNTCFGTADDDVWYSFVASANTHSISLNNVAGSTTDLYHSVFSGTCNSLGTALICSDPNTSIITGLTIGSTYFIRVFSYTSTGGQTSTFSVCVTTPTVPPAPANDNCTGAYPVTINSGTVCTSLTGGTLYGATASTQTNSCGNNYTDDDVWYSFVATDTYHQITLSNVAGSTTDLYHSVYSGTCGTLGTAITCSDPNTSAVNGLTIGNTYYVRVYTFGTTYGATTTFSVCITTPPDPPANTLCSGMTPICSGSAINFTAESNGASAPAGNNYGCLSTYPNPTWFYMEILASGTMAIDLTAGSDVDFALWGPYTNLTAAQASCGSYPSPLDCSYSSSATEQINIPTVIAGEVYVVLVTNYANVVQSITLNQSSGASATTNCAIILPISLLYFNASVNESDEINIQWATETEINNDYFEIQKSTDGYNWAIIATKDGMGNSISKTIYNQVDKNPSSGLSYYRLKQVDFDNTFKYSNIVSVDFSKDKEQITNVRPNPTNDHVYYDFISQSKAIISVEIVSYTGESLLKENKTVEKGNNSFNLSLQEFKNGVYLLKIINENSGKILVQKIIKN